MYVPENGLQRRHSGEHGPVGDGLECLPDALEDAVEYTAEEEDQHNIEEAIDRAIFSAYNTEEESQTYAALWTDVTA